MNDYIQTNNNNIKFIELDMNYYTSQVIDSTIYKFSNLCIIKPQVINSNLIHLLFYQFPTVEVNSIDQLIIDFYRELADQKLRSDLENRFSEIRNIIVKKAFSPISESKE